MEVSSFMRLVEALRKVHPLWFSLEADPPASEDELQEAEVQLQVELPSEYREFLRKFGGGLFAFSNIFSVAPGSDWNIIGKSKEAGLDEIGFLPVSENGVGDFYGYCCRDCQCTSELYFFDHETGRVQPSHYSNLFDYVAEVGLRQEADEEAE